MFVTGIVCHELVPRWALPAIARGDNQILGKIVGPAGLTRDQKQMVRRYLQETFMPEVWRDSEAITEFLSSADSIHRALWRTRPKTHQADRPGIILLRVVLDEFRQQASISRSDPVDPGGLLVDCPLDRQEFLPPRLGLMRSTAKACKFLMVRILGIKPADTKVLKHPGEPKPFPPRTLCD